MGDAFALTMNPLELVLRGTAMYWFLFLIFRFVLRRDAGALGIADILLLVLIADSAQNAMSGGYDTVPEGMVLVATIVAWNWLVDWAGYRYAWARRFAEPHPLVLVRHGRMLARNMRREFITTQELLAHLRQHGIDKLADVKMARMETDGQISVIAYPRVHEEGREVDAGGELRRAPPVG
ncbi:MAG: DUF421 domain-containing protein [Burkholderiaceae bacterium]|nr:DUF421 domain-containing protein [Burkholderiaceae bacterium]